MVVAAHAVIADVDRDALLMMLLLRLTLVLMLILLLMLPRVHLLQRPIKNVAALEAPIILAKNLHEGIVLLAVALVSF